MPAAAARTTTTAIVWKCCGELDSIQSFSGGSTVTASLVVLRTARVEPACGIDLLRCHPARDVAHLLADVVVPSAGRESCELSAQIDRGLSLEPRSAGFAVDFAVTGPTRCDAAQGCPACDDARRLAGGRT